MGGVRHAGRQLDCAWVQGTVGDRGEGMIHLPVADGVGAGSGGPGRWGAGAGSV